MAEGEYRSKSPIPIINVDSAGSKDPKEYLKTLVRKRGAFRSRVTVFKNFLLKLQQGDSSDITSLEIKEISLRLTQLQELMSNFECIQNEIEELSQNLDDQLAEREITESEFYSQIALAQEIIESFSLKAKINNCMEDNLSERSSCCHNTFNSIKLPTINLSSYDGNYVKWLEFRDTFESLIHNNNSIPAINKFHYLRNSLHGSASVVIRSIEFASKNYELAWKTLCDRYNNKNILINNHLHALVSISHIQKESFKSLRYLCDQVSKNLNALNTLDISTSGWDPLVIYLVAAKLDPKTSSKWEEYKGSLSQLPSLEQFKEFLNNRANILETAYCSRNYENKAVFNNNNKSTKTFATFTEGSRDSSCLICNGNHFIYQCNKFKAMDMESRQREASKYKLCTNCLRSGHINAQCTLKGSCRICKKKHNTLLHKVTTVSNVVSENSETSQIPVSLSAVFTGQVLLCTAQVEVINPHNNSIFRARALLDTGSQSSFITKKLKDILCLNTQKINSFNISGINNTVCKIKERCRIKIKSCINSFGLEVNCLVIPQITSDLPNVTIDIEKLELPNNIVLADPCFYKSSEIHMLLGADLFFEIINSNKIKLGPHKPILQDTKLGWIVAGPAGEGYYSNNIQCNLSKNEPMLPLLEISNMIKKFWEIEELPSDYDSHSEDELFSETHFKENTCRLVDGRFSVKMPLREIPEQVLGNSFPLAMKRFLCLEKKLLKNIKVKEQYSNFLKEYATLGHLNEIEKPKFGCYLPHHCVIREHSETTKLRVVFDASARTSSGKSLNDIQAIGPVIQNDLFSILLRFRVHRFVVTADVEKMYRQIALDESQRPLQLILWREEVDQPIKIFQLNTVTYGTASAPFLSTRCLLQLALDCSDDVIANVIKNDFYMDDLNTGASTIEELRYIISGVTQALNSACFPLRKFRTNCSQALINNNIESTDSLNLNTEASVLGLKWLPSSDVLRFPSDIKVEPEVTKRIIISTTCKLFDPLGLVCCCIIKAKILLQHLWSAKLDWDDPVPQDFAKRWFKFINNLHHLSNINLPRYVLNDYTEIDSVQIHCFVDASQHAFGACVYLTTRTNDSTTVQLLCAKARVAPLKGCSIPRLELCAALLGAQLCTKVLEAIPYNITKRFMWTDSTVVLCWLKTQPKSLKAFVSNRVKKINDLTCEFQWSHIPTSINPADLASRGIDPQHLQSSSLWWEGPPFLKKDQSEWPQQPHVSSINVPEIKILLTADDTSKEVNSFIPFENHSNFIKLKRIYAYVLRFVNNCNKNNLKFTGPLSANELNSSITLLLKYSQAESFYKDIHLIKAGKNLHYKSKLLALNPFFDSDGLIRVGGRLEQANCEYDKKYPILLDSKHIFTIIMMKYEHLRLFHAGPQHLLYSIRERFWPIGGRNLARSITRQCVVCVRMRGQTLQPKMGNLPSVKVNVNFPFYSCGTDFAGPFMICSKKGKGNRITKAYLCLFVCLVFKAVHLELVSDLTTEAFILSLRRFVSRRGKPYVIYCDNGKNFVGANNELGKVIRSSRPAISNYAANEGIKFRFSPAYAPHFGGAWESGIKSCKFHLKRIAGNASLTFEELATLFTQIEAILNSRPLTPLSSDPTDIYPLTPGHFLIGRPLMSVPTLPVTSARPNRYQKIEQVRQQFWERWRREYMAEIQNRTKWRKDQRNLQVGDLVIIKEDNLMPLHWRMGRVTSLFPGTDGVVRVADVYTEKGTIRRATNKLCLLPLSMDHLEADASNAAEDVHATSA